VQVEEPADEAKTPTAQGLHGDEAPVELLKVPATQLVQLADPVDA